MQSEDIQNIDLNPKWLSINVFKDLNLRKIRKRSPNMVLTTCIKKQPYTGKFYAKKMQLYNTDSVSHFLRMDKEP